jgi:hypothetical protein
VKEWMFGVFKDLSPHFIESLVRCQRISAEDLEIAINLFEQYLSFIPTVIEEAALIIEKGDGSDDLKKMAREVVHCITELSQNIS